VSNSYGEFYFLNRVTLAIHSSAFEWESKFIYFELILIFLFNIDLFHRHVNILSFSVWGWSFKFAEIVKKMAYVLSKIRFALIAILLQW